MGNYEIGLDILITAKQLQRYMDASCPVRELNGGQMRIIALIHRREEQKLDTFQRDVEAELSIRRSSVSSVLQLMEKNGYIERVSVTSDARLKKLVLTKKGREADEKLGKNIYDIERLLSSLVKDEEAEVLKNSLGKIREALKEEEADV